MQKIFKHIACRNSLYAKTIQRFTVPDEFVDWSTTYDDYKPTFYESPALANKPWADPSIDNKDFKPKFNDLDDNVNRVSHLGVYQVEGKLPLNPFGRTGISGRGILGENFQNIFKTTATHLILILGRFGPNHAADPIVSTWKRDEDKNIVKHLKTNKPVIRILCIQRGDTKEIALPGGMVDTGEEVSQTLKREFVEEALNGKIQESELDDFFANGHDVYRGYVDDPRNTDNGGCLYRRF